MKDVKRILVSVLKGLIMGLIIGLGNFWIHGTEDWWKTAIFATCLITAGYLVRIVIDTNKKKRKK